MRSNQMAAQRDTVQSTSADDTHIAANEVRARWLWIALVAALPPVLAVIQLGRLHADEVFQFLEPAQFRAFGTGQLKWEWTAGLRNWAIPLALSWLLRLCHALRIDDPQARRAVLAIPQYLLHAASLGAVYRFARRRVAPGSSGAGLCDPALAAVCLVGLTAPVLEFAGRTLGESFSTSLLILGLERADARGRRARVYAAAGAWIGLAVVARYGSAIIAVAAVAYLLFERRFRDALALCAGGAIVATLLGVLDLETWGAPFHSLWRYVEFNVISGRAAARFGSSPAYQYLPWLAAAVAPWAWLALAIAVKHARRASGARTSSELAQPSALILFCTGTYVAAISATAHKEPRFLYPAIVLFAVALTPSWVSTLSRLPAPQALGAMVASIATGLVLLAFHSRFAAQYGEQFRLVVAAARTGTGVIHCPTERTAVSGQFYAADRPWAHCDPRKRATSLARLTLDPIYNRVVTSDASLTQILSDRGFHPLEQSPNAILWARP